MIELCQRDEIVAPDVVVDEYGPVTVTWPEAQRLLDPPRYVRFAGAGRLLELKFHPQTRQLIEAVLVSAAGAERGEGSLSPGSTDRAAGACLAEGIETANEEHELSRLVGYDDCLVIGLAPPMPTAWTGTRPVLFGLDDSSDVVALCVVWEAGEREIYLSATE